MSIFIVHSGQFEQTPFKPIVRGRPTPWVPNLGLTQVASLYSAKLASGLGVPHSLEDKIQCNDSLGVLTSKYSLFRNQIEELTLAIKGALSIEGEGGGGGGGTDAGAYVSRLQSAFRASLSLVCADTQALQANKLRHFCATCGNMLQEACTKFSQLTEILAACKHKIGDD
ncbi:hypothetical protein evm_000488 [Chilo suppressalis]|nr:hypothetical protein evm_000488 [Chilo suppressalis]